MTPLELRKPRRVPPPCEQCRVHANGRLACITHVAAALLLFFAAAPAPADTLSSDRQRDVLHTAIAAYERGTDLIASDPAASSAAFREALAGFLSLRAAGIDNAALELNIGNTHYRLGDLGKAILHLRRAAALAPGDARIADNLRFVRARVEPQIPLSAESQVWRQLAFLHYETSLTWRFAAFLGLATPGWLLLFAWLRWPRRSLAVSGCVCVILGLTFAASVLWQQHTNFHTPAAVVIEPSPLRHGRGEGADLALDQPLGPGVELHILDQRGHWIQVRLADGRTGWLPATTLERL